MNKRKPIMHAKKLNFYVKSSVLDIVPSRVFEQHYSRMFDALNEHQWANIRERANYYNKLQDDFVLDNEAIKIKDLLLRKNHSSYYYDFKAISRYFDSRLRFNYIFDDINESVSVPTILKSRPINSSNENSVLMKLDRVRHFNFIQDKISFSRKIDLAVFRGACYQQNRQDFIKKHLTTPMTNVGNTDSSQKGQRGFRPFMKISDQLCYKFIISLEGNDVATNLKWIMSSNSLCLMPKPRVESWFLEGQLISGYHFVQLHDDFSNLEELIAYYSEHSDEALAIIKNANRHVLQFLDIRQEKLISILVLRKYFNLSGQREPGSIYQRSA